MIPIIYLDNSATTRVTDEVLEAMHPFQTDWWGNPSSIHAMGRKSRSAIDIARQQVAGLIGANPGEIFFTPSATYSNNVAILGRARFVEAANMGRHIITTGIEHSSALGPVKHLEARGWRVTTLSVNREGFIDTGELISAIRPDTSIVSIMWANNEVGTVQPIREIAEIAQKHCIFFHSDAVQVAGKLPINVADLQVDTLSLSGHKFHAPKGIGILYRRSRAEVLPIVFGGGQEEGFFPGTEALASIVGVGKAAELAKLDLTNNERKLRAIQQMLIEKLTRVSGVRLTGARDLRNRLPGHVSLIVDGATGEDLVAEASAKGIYISSVSACSGRDPSHVLKCMGFDRDEVLGSARISAGRFNTQSECEKAACVLGEIFASRATGVCPQTSQEKHSWAEMDSLNPFKVHTYA